MFGLELLSVETLGILAAAVAGLLSLIPSLGMSDSRRATVAVATILVAVFVQDDFTFASWQGFLTEAFTAAVYALVTYKMLLQPLVLPVVEKGFKAMGVKAKFQG